MFVESVLNWIDPSTMMGEVIQAILQMIVWKLIFEWVTYYVKRKYYLSEWYQQAIAAGEEHEFLHLLCAFPQHSVSAILVYLAIYFGNTSLFCSGTLGEFAFEALDLYNIILNKWYYKTLRMDNKTIAAMIFHHVAGILVIIPVNIQCGDNIYIQKVAFGLLAATPLLILIYILMKTRDIYDLRQRGQFTVFLFICIVGLIYNRCYWVPLAMYDAVYYQFKYLELSMAMKSILIFYGLLINISNILFLFIFSYRFYLFLYDDKYSEDPNKIYSMSMYSMSMPIINRMNIKQQKKLI